MSTQLFDKEHNTIFPITEASAVKTAGDQTSGNKNNVAQCISDLYTKISKLEGADEAVSSIRVDVSYCRYDNDSQNEVIENGNWQTSFLSPTSDYPYVWKKTVYTFAGDTTGGKTVYEIVASDISEKIQNIYIAMPTTGQPTINYEILKNQNGEDIVDEEGNPKEDLTTFDKKLPDGWSESPQSVSAATPYVYLSTRKKVEGKWQRFTPPALFGKWTFDSYIEIRYQVSDNKPSVNTNSIDPGSGWLTEINEDFTGKLWIITGTSVNGTLTADNNNIVWKGPNLISIV